MKSWHSFSSLPLFFLHSFSLSEKSKYKINYSFEIKQIRSLIIFSGEIYNLRFILTSILIKINEDLRILLLFFFWLKLLNNKYHFIWHYWKMSVSRFWFYFYILAVLITFCIWCCQVQSNIMLWNKNKYIYEYFYLHTSTLNPDLGFYIMNYKSKNKTIKYSFMDVISSFNVLI